MTQDNPTEENVHPNAEPELPELYALKPSAPIATPSYTSRLDPDDIVFDDSEHTKRRLLRIKYPLRSYF